MRPRDLLVLLLVPACGAEEPVDPPPPACDDPTMFGPPSELVAAAAKVEYGGGGFALLRGSAPTLTARIEISDGLVGRDAGLSAKAEDPLAAGAVALGTGAWAVLWADAVPPAMASLEYAELTTDGVVAGRRTWFALREPVSLAKLVRTPSGLAALWRDRFDTLRLAIAADGAGPAVHELGPGTAGTLVAAGDELGAVWADLDGDVWFARLTSAGETIGAPIYVAPLADYLAPALCRNAFGFWIAYTDRPDPAQLGDIMVIRIADGLASEPLRVSRGDGASWAPAIACRADSYGIAWVHNTGDLGSGGLAASRIELAIVSADGGTATSPAIVGDRPETLAMQPTVGVWGDGYSVAWSEYTARDGYRHVITTNDGCAAP